MLTVLLLEKSFGDIIAVFTVLFFLVVAVLAAGPLWLLVKGVGRAWAKHKQGKRSGLPVLLLLGLIIGGLIFLLLGSIPY